MDADHPTNGVNFARRNTISAKELGKVVYMLANGQGKVRATGSGLAIAPAVWRTDLFSTGEISVAHKLAEVGRRAMAGHAVRLLDLYASASLHGAFDDLHDAPRGAEFAERLKRAVTEHHGTVGPAFVLFLLQKRVGSLGSLQRTVEAIAGNLVRKCLINGNGQAERAAQRFAVIAAAGEFSALAGLTGWKKGEALTVATQGMASWLRGRNTQRSDMGASADKRMRAFLATNAEEFTESDPTSERMKPGAYGWKDANHFSDV